MQLNINMYSIIIKGTIIAINIKINRYFQIISYFKNELMIILIIAKSMLES